MYLGLDVQADISSYTLLTPDRTEKPNNGRVNLEGFAQLLKHSKPSFLACEFTGRLAIPYARIAKEHGVKVYFLDTVSRAAYTRIFGQTSKTDKQDAKTIAAVFRRWAEHEQEYAMNPHLFLDAEMVEEAWLLRAMLYELKQLRRFQVSARLKAITAERTEMPAVAVRWLAIAEALPLAAADQEVATFAAQLFPEEMRLLQTIPGVGAVLAPWIIAILHPVDRFDTYWKAKRYIGFNPRQNDSGAKTGKQKISRTGNSTIRGLLYISAMGQAPPKLTEADKAAAAVGKRRPGRREETRFTDLWKRKIQAGTPGKKAAVAVAESIFCVCYYVLKSGKPYHDPSRPTITAEVRPVQLVTQAEAARQLDISRQAVAQRVKSGSLTSEEWQGKHYVLEAALLEALEEKAWKTKKAELTEGGPE